VISFCSILILITLSFSGFTGIDNTSSDVTISNSKKSPSTSTSILTPTTSTIIPEKKSISYENYEAKSVQKTQDYSLNKSFQFLLDAYAVSSTQNSLNVVTLQVPGGFESHLGYDPDHNWLIRSTNFLEIAFVDIASNTMTVWLLPNDDRASFNAWGKNVVDSSGNIYFSGTSSPPTGSIGKINRLNPSTDVFTEWTTAGGGSVFVDSSDNVFFVSGQLKLLDPSTNSLTTWSGLGQIRDSYMDPSGNLYFISQTSGPGIIKRLNTNTNELTTWNLPSNLEDRIAPDPTGNIFFKGNDETRGTIGRITISDNVLTEWIIPDTGIEGVNAFGVDINGNVYFDFAEFSRFVPDTEIFTEFSGLNNCFFLDFDSSGAIYCTLDQHLKKIT